MTFIDNLTARMTILHLNGQIFVLVIQTIELHFITVKYQDAQK